MDQIGEVDGAGVQARGGRTLTCKRLRARIGLAAALMLAWPGSDGPAHAERAGPFSENLRYDPAKCSPPVTDDKVRIMLGRVVLALPAGDVGDIGGMADRERKALPARPDPTQPEGCPDNPMWGGGFTIRFPYPGVTDDGGESTEWASARLVYSINDRALLQEGDERIAERRCNQAPAGSIRTRLSNGFTVCRVRPDIKSPLENWSTTYIADATTYTAPNGRPFIILCLFGELTSGSYGCTVSYRLRPNLNVFYKVDFRRTLMDEVIALDSALRRAVRDAEVANYPWPDLGRSDIRE